jgi:hypothetical protein
MYTVFRVQLYPHSVTYQLTRQSPADPPPLPIRQTAQTHCPMLIIKQGDVFGFFMYFIQHCFICLPSDSTVSEDAGIEPRMAATMAFAVRRSNHSGRSHTRLAIFHPHSARSHPLSARYHPHSARSHQLSARSHPHSARSHPHFAKSHPH